MAVKHGRRRRYLTRDQSDLYPGRPDFCREYAVQLASGLWMGTNYSRRSISDIIRLAAEVAGLTLGEDLIVCLGQ